MKVDQALAHGRESLQNGGHRAYDCLRDLVAALDAPADEVTDEYARAFHDGWLACERGDVEPPVPAQQPTVAVPTTVTECDFIGSFLDLFEDSEPNALIAKRALAKIKAAGYAVVPEVLLEIGRRLAEDRKRNDHHTADPIYTVQREVRIYGLDADYAERFAWIEGSELCASDLSARLERRFNRGWTIPERYRRVGYCTHWEFVDAYLSYDAAKRRVEYESRKHHGTYRTYVESGCRNHEWKALQAWLLAAANKENNRD